MTTLNHPPDNFLGLEAEYSDVAHAGVLVLPIPFEATVSYGHGTARGPEAILVASQQVELYDREYDDEPALRYGVHTLPALELPDDPAATVAAIRAAVAEAARSGKLLVALGGEHTVSVGVGFGLIDALGGPLTVVQIDAHSDLRDQYEGTPYSHACIARRLLESSQIEQVLQLGIRSVCAEEIAFARSHPDRVVIWYAEAVHDGSWRKAFVERVKGRRVFLTIDVDGLDPSIVPTTGTPEPDGLTWQETLEILRMLNEHAEVIGIDCVELAPLPGLHMADFAVAKLVYKAISYTMMRSATRMRPA